MATLTVTGSSVVGDLRLVTFTLALDSSYPTGGEGLSREDLGFTTEVKYLDCSPAKGLVFEYDYSGEKLKAFFPTGGAGTPGSALAAPSATIATGATTVTGEDATPGVAINPGVGIEVANEQNLSTVTVRGFALGV